MRNEAKVTPINAELVNTTLTALNSAQDALEHAKVLLAKAGIDPASVGLNTQVSTPAANKSNRSTSSGGRIPTGEQMEVRNLITEWAASDKADIFTVKSMTEHLGKDRVQVRNAINALTESGVLTRWAEKLPEGRGAREIVYKPTSFNVGI